MGAGPSKILTVCNVESRVENGMKFGVVQCWYGKIRTLVARGWTVCCAILSHFIPPERGKGAEKGRKCVRNIGLLGHKVRMFAMESTDVFAKEVRCFCPKTRHFLGYFRCF